ncbi:MAG: lipopolysaccharide biosynthesis protein [Actinomycetales bacterium]
MTTRQDSATKEANIRDGSQPDTPGGPGTPDGPDQGRLGRAVGRGAAWAFVANLTMRAANIAVTALLARLLSPEDFGIFAIALAVSVVVASLAELGMGSVIARSAQEPSRIAPTVTTVSIVTATALALIMAASAPGLATLLGQPAAAEPIRILSLSLFLTGVFAVPGAQLVREFKQDRIFLGTVVGFVVANPILIVLAINGGGAQAFAWSRVIGQLATGLVFVLSTSRRYRPGWRPAEVGALLRFGLPLSFANLVNWTLLNADYLVLGRLTDAASVGTYMIAFNVAGWTTALLGSVLNSVVVPALARVRDDAQAYPHALLTASRVVTVFAFGVGALTLALARPLVLTLFGPTWSASAPILQVLAIYGTIYAFTLLATNVLVAAGTTLRLLVIQLLWVAVLVPAIIVGIRHDGLVGVAWAHVITIVVVVAPAYLGSVLKVTGLKLRALIGVTLRPGIAAVLAGITALSISHLFAWAPVSLLLGGSAGALVYVGLTVALLRRWLPAGWGRLGRRRPAGRQPEQAACGGDGA